MTDQPELSLEAQLEAIDIECHYRQTKIRQSTSMKDVAQLKDLAARGELRAHLYKVAGPRSLETSAEQRMRELLDGHLMELRGQSSLPSLEALRGQYLYREWVYLKTSFPAMYREAEIESDKLIVRLERETEARSRRMRGRT